MRLNEFGGMLGLTPVWLLEDPLVEFEGVDLWMLLDVLFETGI